MTIAYCEAHVFSIKRNKYTNNNQQKIISNVVIWMTIAYCEAGEQTELCGTIW